MQGTLLACLYKMDHCDLKFCGTAAVALVQLLKGNELNLSQTKVTFVYAFCTYKSYAAIEGGWGWEDGFWSMAIGSVKQEVQETRKYNGFFRATTESEY